MSGTSPQPLPCHIVYSNTLPTSSQLHHAIAFIGDQKAKEKECLDHITRLEAHRAKILEEIQVHRDKQTTIRRKITEHERVFAPVRRLHPHVLSEIFAFCVENEPLRGPIRISAVCRMWRTVARSTPRVWSHICIDIKSPSCEEVCRTWASLSGTRPLRITFLHPNIWVTRRQLAFNNIMKALGPNFSRCEKISIGTCSEEDNDSVLQALQSCSRLREVILSFYAVSKSISLAKCSILAQGIENLEISDVDDSRLGLFAPPFTRLRHLEVSGRKLTSHAIRSILASATLLEECIAHIGLKGDMDGTPAGVINLPYLRTLNLTSDTQVDIGVSLLQDLYSPVLSFLEIDCASEGLHTPEWPHLHTLLSRSKPPLKSLSIKSIETPSLQLYECLLVATTIQTIHLQGVPGVNELLGWLAQPCRDGDPMTILCPHLESLEINDCAGIDGRTICDFVDKRTPPREYLLPRDLKAKADHSRFLQPACHGNPAFVTRFSVSECDIREDPEQSSWLCDRLSNTGVQWNVQWSRWGESEDEDEYISYDGPYSAWGWSGTGGYHDDSGPDTETEEYFNQHDGF